MGLFSKLFAPSDNEGEVKLLDAFYRLLFMCVFLKAKEEEDSGSKTEKIAVNDIRSAVSETGLFTILTQGTELKTAQKENQDALDVIFNPSIALNKNEYESIITNNINTYSSVINNAGQNAVEKFNAIISDKFGNLTNDGNHPKLSQLIAKISERF